jgi:hypothetical protein
MSSENDRPRQALGSADRDLRKAPPVIVHLLRLDSRHNDHLPARNRVTKTADCPLILPVLRRERRLAVSRPGGCPRNRRATGLDRIRMLERRRWRPLEHPCCTPSTAGRRPHRVTRRVWGGATTAHQRNCALSAARDPQSTKGAPDGIRWVGLTFTYASWAAARDLVVRDGLRLVLTSASRLRIPAAVDSSSLTPVLTRRTLLRAAGRRGPGGDARAAGVGASGAGQLFSPPSR